MDQTVDERYGVSFSLRFSRINPREAQALDYLLSLDKKERVRLMKDCIIEQALQSDHTIVDPWQGKQFKAVRATLADVMQEVRLLRDMMHKLKSGVFPTQEITPDNNLDLPDTFVTNVRAARRPGLRLDDPASFQEVSEETSRISDDIRSGRIKPQG